MSRFFFFLPFQNCTVVPDIIESRTIVLEWGDISSMQHLMLSGDIFGCRHWGEGWGELPASMGSSQNSPHDTELSGPKHQ